MVYQKAGCYCEQYIILPNPNYVKSRPLNYAPDLYSLTPLY